MPHTHTRNPLDSIISCRACHLTLAGIAAGLVIVRRDKSEFVVERVHSIKCHRCGENNQIIPTLIEPAIVTAT